MVEKPRPRAKTRKKRCLHCAIERLVIDEAKERGGTIDVLEVVHALAEATADIVGVEDRTAERRALLAEWAEQFNARLRQKREKAASAQHSKHVH